MRRAGQVVSKDEILAGVWEFDFDGDPNIVEVYVGRLRRKLDEPFGTRHITTVRGAGYRMDGDARMAAGAARTGTVASGSRRWRPSPSPSCSASPAWCWSLSSAAGSPSNSTRRWSPGPAPDRCRRSGARAGQPSATTTSWPRSSTGRHRARRIERSTALRRSARCPTASSTWRTSTASAPTARRTDGVPAFDAPDGCSGVVHVASPLDDIDESVAELIASLLLIVPGDGCPRRHRVAARRAHAAPGRADPHRGRRDRARRARPAGA